MVSRKDWVVEFIKRPVVPFKNLAGLDEKWLQQQIVNDPGLLGLGDRGQPALFEDVGVAIPTEPERAVA